MKFLENLQSRFFRIVPKEAFWQFFRFAVVGVVNTAIDWVGYYALTKGTVFWADQKIWANMVSFTAAATFSFFANRRWTFRDSDQRIARQYGIFFLVSVGGLFLNESIFYVTVLQRGWADYFGKFLATIASLLWNFILNKTVTFRNPKSSDHSLSEGGKI